MESSPHPRSCGSAQRPIRTSQRRRGDNRTEPRCDGRASPTNGASPIPEMVPRLATVVVEQRSAPECASYHMAGTGPSRNAQYEGENAWTTSKRRTREEGGSITLLKSPPSQVSHPLKEAKGAWNRGFMGRTPLLSQGGCGVGCKAICTDAQVHSLASQNIHRGPCEADLHGGRRVGTAHLLGCPKPARGWRGISPSISFG